MSQRIIIWLAVLVACVAVGMYVSKAPSSDGLPSRSTSDGQFLFIAGGSDPYWQLCVAGAKAAASELGSQVDVRLPQSEDDAGLREQLDWLTTFEKNTYSGVAIGPINPGRETTSVNAVAASVPVVTVDSDMPESERIFYIGSANHAAGGLAAELLREATPQGGQVAVLMASLAKTNAADRKQGFEEMLAEEESDAAHEVVNFYMDQGDLAKCRDNVRRACEDHPDLVAIVGTFGYHGPVALEVLEELGLKGKVRVIAFDEAEETLAGVEQGDVYATIVQDPFMFGYESIRMLDQFHRGHILSKPISGQVNVGVPCLSVKQSNLEEFRDKLQQRLDAAAVDPEASS